MSNRGVRRYNALNGALTELHNDKCNVDFENTLQDINEIIELIFEEISQVSDKFDLLCTGYQMTGSVQDGLKIQAPDEFDVNICLDVSEFFKLKAYRSDEPGFSNLKLYRYSRATFPKFSSCIDNCNYLLSDRFKNRFFQSIFERVINKYRCFDGPYYIDGKTKSSPANTLILRNASGEQISIDFSPSIHLGNNVYAVGKSPADIPYANQYFRLNRQVDEGIIMIDKNFLKPTLRLVKLIRNVFEQQVSSYVIKTMFLLELQQHKEGEGFHPRLFNCPLSYCFVKMLERYADYLEEGEIPYYWDQGLNLLQLDESQSNHYCDQIDQLLDVLNSRPFDKYEFLEYFY